MPSQLNPYLSFKSHAREAMEFYRTVFGGTLVMQTYGEGHASQDPIESKLIMHAELKGDHGIVFMASDTPPHMEYRPGSNISMSLSGDDEAELTSYFEKLSPGATVTMPLSKAPWGDTFGMLTDKYGIAWLVNIAGPKI